MKDVTGEQSPIAYVTAVVVEVELFLGTLAQKQDNKSYCFRGSSARLTEHEDMHLQERKNTPRLNLKRYRSTAEVKMLNVLIYF